MLTRLNLSGFQTWKSLDLPLAPLTVIYGPSGLGKSSIIRALNSLITSQLLAADITHGSSTVRISLETDEGWIVDRIKSSSLNRYELEIEGRTRSFDKVGKACPDDILALFNLPLVVVDSPRNLAISEQFEPPIIIYDTPPNAARTLIAVTGISNVTRAQKKIESKRRQISAQLTYINTTLSEITADVSIRPSIKALKEHDEITDPKIKQFKGLLNRIQQLRELKVKEPIQPREVIEIGDLDDSIQTLRDLQSAWQLIPNKSLPPRQQLSALTDKVNRLISISSRMEELRSLRSNTNGSLRALFENSMTLKKLEEDYHLLMPEGICPLCGNPVR